MSESFPVRIVWQPADTEEPCETTAVLTVHQLSTLRSAAKQAHEQDLEAVTWIPIRQENGSVCKRLFRLRRIISAERTDR